MEQEQNSKKDKRKKIIFWILVLGSAAAALKCIFVSLQMDEEYAISMSYRLLRGDRLLAQLWDPHQTSAFMIEFLMWIYVSLFHTTTCSVIFVRLAGVIMQGLVSWQLYKTFAMVLDQEKSFYLALIYFNLLPKGYVMPEFSNMMVWSLTMLLVCLTRLYLLEEKKVWNRQIMWKSAEAGLWLCLLVLSYPSCAIVYPFILLYLLLFDPFRLRTAGILTGVCAVSGGAYLAVLFSYMTPLRMGENIKSLIASCGSHSRTIWQTLHVYAGDAASGLIFAALYLAATVLVMYFAEREGLKYLLASLFHKTEKTEEKDRKYGMAFQFLFLITAFTLQFIHWILMRWQYESSYPFTVYFFLLGFAVYAAVRKGAADRKKAVQQERHSRFSVLAFLWIGGNLVMFLAILMLTNLTIFTSVKYLMPGVTAGVVIMILYARECSPEIYHKYAGITLLVWCFVAAFVKGWAYPDNDGLMKNITCVGNVLREGPGKGILTEYMQGYMQKNNYEEFHTYIKPGDKLLVMDSNTLCYLYQDVDISAASTICTPTFDANLLDYWKRNPDKYPTVIAVECWYGELKYDENSWMMKWIENDYKADQVINGKYFRYYIRR